MNRNAGSRSWLGWFFRSRETGQVVIAQAPNLPLWVFLAAAAARATFRPNGGAGAAVAVVAGGALVWWSAGEIGWGVNPFRRIVGGIVLVGLALGRVMR